MLLDVDDDCQFCLECENENIKDSKDIETYSENKCKFCPSNYPFGRKNCSA